MFKKMLFSGLGFALLATPLLASADSFSDIQALQAQIQTLMARLAALQAQSGEQSFCYNFSNDLTIGSTGEDVSALNRALSASGINLAGNPSVFTEDNAGDVVSFQAKYRIRQTGYVGPITRRKLNELYGCRNNQRPTRIVPIEIQQPAQTTPQVLPVQTTPQILPAQSAGSVFPSQTTQPVQAAQLVLPAQPTRPTATPVLATSPSVTVLSPNGGGYWYIGKNELVEWNTANVPNVSQMYIRLRSYDSGKEYDLVTSSNDGYENLVVPTTIPAGAYTLEIKTSVNGQSYVGASASYFKVVDPTDIVAIEQDKCVFNEANSTTQKCYADVPSSSLGEPAHFGCNGVGTCTVTINGKRGTPITWGSSCGGSAETTIDGVSEYANFNCAEVVPPSITILSPNGGGYWYRGKTELVVWTSEKISPYNQMLIRLRDIDTGKEYNLTTVNNDGNERVHVPSDAPAGGYVLEIKTEVGSQGYSDASDSYFKIVDPA